MATLSAAMVALLTANWAGAGAAPTFGALVDFRKDLADTAEQVIVRLPIHEDVDPINDNLSNFKYIIQLRIKTNVSEDRLKVLTDETIRIINSYAITGITRQFAKRGENTSDRRRKIYSYDVWANLEEHASTAGTSYSSPGAGDVIMPADLTVTDDFGFDTGETVDIIRDEDNMASDDEDALATQQSIKAYVDAAGGGDAFKTITGITNDVVADSATDTLTLASADAKLTIVGTAATDTITFTVDETQISHDNIADVSTSDHHVLYTDAEAIAAVVAENPLTLTNDLTVSGGDIKTPSSMSLDALGAGVIRLKRAGAEKVYIGANARFFIDIQADNDILTQSNKSADVGATGVAWDNMYADDYVNESPFKKFDKPLDKLKKIKDKDGELDYKSLPDWVRATKRINQVIEIDKDGNKTVIEEGEKVVAEKGLSINRMCILLYQALQEATARIEALEAR